MIWLVYCDVLTQQHTGLKNNLQRLIGDIFPPNKRNHLSKSNLKQYHNIKRDTKCWRVTTYWGILNLIQLLQQTMWSGEMKWLWYCCTESNLVRTATVKEVHHQHLQVNMYVFYPYPGVYVVSCQDFNVFFFT